ncbi:hypothetical protein AB0I81_01830 [Nonomuraea sp. NPDC050404]|uniref:hypothetical protein n=1 Tax=Nonomuraea sp. NPDC050404 TaxID=3155783 RepID=UPI0033D9533D
MAVRETPLDLDLSSLDVMTVALPASEVLVEAVAMGLGNTEIGASGCTSGKSWLV